MKQQIETLRQIISTSGNIVFLGGAGVSTESGIPDFRSAGGLYKQKYKYSPEKMLTRSFFMSHPEEFYDLYKNKMLYLDAQPNKAHQQLFEMEKMGKLKAVITQNVDGLHQKAGSKNVLELHGSVYRNYCLACGKFYDINAVTGAALVPVCQCGGIIRPDVVLYEESLDNALLKKASQYIAQADVLLVGGTSLEVYPAASLIDYYRGNGLIIINKSPTPLDFRANLLICGSIGKVLGEL